MSGGFPLFPAISDPVRWWSGVDGGKLALIDRAADQRITYAELEAATRRWSALLQGAGIRSGDRVAWIGGNRHEAVPLFFACGRLGAALVPLNWRLARPELASVLEDAAPRAVIGESRFRRAAETAAGSARWIDIDEDAPALLRGPGSEPAATAPGADDPWLVLYTSGSTGTPKGAMLPHRQILYNAFATTTGWSLGASDVAPISTPFFHTGGWNVFATPIWYRGGTAVLFDRFEPDDFIDGLAEEGCTMALTVPTQLVMMLESRSWGRPLPALRTLMSGGAPCPPRVLERVRAAGYALREGYGLTECGPNCFAISARESLENPNCVGRPMPFLETRLVTDDGRDAEIDEPGELWLRGPQMFAGYLGSPERTAEVIAPGGWLRTGDLARRDSEGRYRICGRRKEMFISGGENVFPGEVEAALAECPGISEVVVIGVPDELWGEVGRAYVVARDGAMLAPETVVAFAREKLAGYKVPRSVVLLDELPRLGSGKADRRALAR
jgi:fatty-acyl-CoA synthase